MKRVYIKIKKRFLIVNIKKIITIWLRYMKGFVKIPFSNFLIMMDNNLKLYSIGFFDHIITLNLHRLNQYYQQLLLLFPFLYLCFIYIYIYIYF